MKIPLTHIYESRGVLIARVKESDCPIKRKTAKDGQITCVAVDQIGAITPYCDYLGGYTTNNVTCTANPRKVILI